MRSSCRWTPFDLSGEPGCRAAPESLVWLGTTKSKESRRHRKLDVLAERGFVVLRDYDGPAIPPVEWESLDYVDWKSGGDTNFAPLASANGDMECHGFWEHGKLDKGGVWTDNRKIAPSPGSLRRCDRRQLRPGAGHQAQSQR